MQFRKSIQDLVPRAEEICNDGDWELEGNEVVDDGFFGLNFIFNAFLFTVSWVFYCLIKYRMFLILLFDDTVISCEFLY